MRRTIRTATFLTAICLALTGLGALPAVADDEEPEANEESTDDFDVIGQVESSEGFADGGMVVIHSLDRSADSIVTLVWTLGVSPEAPDNVRTTSITPRGFNPYPTASVGGVTLLDPESRTRYYPLVDEAEECLCAGGDISQAVPTSVVPGTAVPYWNMYLLPDDVDSVSVEVAGFPPVEDIAVN